LPNLSRLSEGERRVLSLLAQGHTAKSAATTLGITEGAVNERLREARRKTGVGSSRELARLVGGPQETRDEEIGVAVRRSADDEERRPRVGWPILVGALSMIVLASAVGAFAALAVVGHPAPTPGAAPRVVSTSPAVGAEIPAGKIVIKVTFDQPMQPKSFSFVMRDRESFPKCAATPNQSADGKTYSLDCTVQAGKTYWIGFNSPSNTFFKSLAGVPAVPAALQFTAH
jgi:DNA-binding CsgD family transcriptional regulator